jgi:glycosyl transferase family 25
MKIGEIKSFVINLRSKQEQYHSTARTLYPLGIRPERFDAVNPSEIPADTLHELLYPSVSYHIRTERLIDNHFSSYGAVGCSLSHILLWKKLVESDQEMFLIFEDDIYLDASEEEIQSYLSSIQRMPWDVAYLGYIKPKLATSDVRIRSNVLRIADMTLTTHAYLIHRRGAEKLLRYAIPIVDQIDSYMSYMTEKGVRMYRPGRSLVKQHLGKFSDLQNVTLRVLLSRLSNRTWIIVIAVLILFVFWIRKK